MKAKAYRTKDGVQFLVPQDSPLLQQLTSEAEIFHLRDGHFLISFGGVAGQKTDDSGVKSPAAATGAQVMASASKISPSSQAIRPESAPSDEEISVLKKLSAFPFATRIPSNVDKSFSVAERKILQSLIKKKLVTLFVSDKYKSGVYNIASSVYPHMQGGVALASSRPGNVAFASAKANASASYSLSSPEHLEQKGYMIVESEGEARMMGVRLEPALKSGDIIGVRGFDRKFYVAKKAFYIAHEEAMRAALAKKPLTFEGAGAACGIEPAAAHVLLVLLADKGEIIEKAKGTYANA